MKNTKIILYKIYLKYLCYLYNSSLPKLSRSMGHKSNWLTADIFNLHSTISTDSYNKCLKLLAQKFHIPKHLQDILTTNDFNEFDSVLDSIHKNITTRRDLIGYIKILLGLRNESFITLASNAHKSSNYFRTGLINTNSGHSYYKLLVKLADSLKLPRQKFTRFSNLPKVRHNNIGRKRINKFLICYAKASETNLKALFKQSTHDLQYKILRSSANTFKQCLTKISKALHIHMSTFKLVINDDPVIYKSIRQMALNHIKDRKSLENCVTCLALCNNTSLQKIGNTYHLTNDRIIECISRDYYQPIEHLLIKISPALSVDKDYIHKAMKLSHIPKRHGINGRYDNLIALIKCLCIQKGITISDLSRKVFNGNKDKLSELMNKDFRELNHSIFHQLSLIGIPKSDITKIMNGNNQPLKQLIKTMRQQIHNRKTLIKYIRCLAFKHHTVLTQLSRKLHRQNGYIYGTLLTGYYDIITDLFKNLSKMLNEPLDLLMEALHKSHIRYAVHLTPIAHRKQTKLDKASRVNIKNQLYSLIRQHHIYPSRLAYKIHPKTKYNSILSTHLLNCSKETLINEITLVLNYLHEPPKQLKAVLDKNKMGKYYPLLIQRCHELKN